jgi:hypothetical protein
MANNTLVIGLVPLPTIVNQPLTVSQAACETSAALFVNSPIVITSGVATAVGTADSSKITGSIVAIRNSYGQSVSSKPASTAGYVCEYTYLPDQQYICTVNGTDYSDTGASENWILEAETATANADPELGDATSKRQLITPSASAGPIRVIIRTPMDNSYNAAGVAGTQVLCVINSSNYEPRN